MKVESPVLLEIKIKPGSRSNLNRADITPKALKNLVSVVLGKNGVKIDEL